MVLVNSWVISLIVSLSLEAPSCVRARICHSRKLLVSLSYSFIRIRRYCSFRRPRLLSRALSSALSGVSARLSLTAGAGGGGFAVATFDGGVSSGVLLPFLLLPLELSFVLSPALGSQSVILHICLEFALYALRLLFLAQFFPTHWPPWDYDLSLSHLHVAILVLSLDLSNFPNLNALIL